MSQFQLHENPTDINPEQVLDLYHLIGGDRPNLDEEIIRKAFLNSAYMATVTLPDGELIGWIRALSDGVSTTWIPEMVSHPDYTALGVDGMLLDAVINNYKHTTVYFQTFHTDFTERAGFYEKRGIKPMPNLIVCAKK
ncbi:MAG: GNAT family N-acetyltransferase [Candidatus Sericytochromatia bacterium]|nr:GNAT family N-acetyltransferase [Candidatus Sericytochromatia bacterium]